MEMLVDRNKEKKEKAAAKFRGLVCSKRGRGQSRDVGVAELMSKDVVVEEKGPTHGKPGKGFQLRGRGRGQRMDTSNSVIEEIRGVSNGNRGRGLHCRDRGRGMDFSKRVSNDVSEEGRGRACGM